MRSITTLLFLALFAPFVMAASGGGGTATVSQGGANVSKGAEVREVETVPGKETVEPGETHTNNDGVTVANDADSDGDIDMNPKSGTADSATTVDVKNDATGTVSGIDGNDTVNTAHGSTTTISGTGGTVNAGSGSSGSVTNTNPAGSGGASITITGGAVPIHVPPGSTVTFG